MPEYDDYEWEEVEPAATESEPADVVHVEAAIAEARTGPSPPARARATVSQIRKAYNAIAAHVRRLGIVHPLFTYQPDNEGGEY